MAQADWRGSKVGTQQRPGAVLHSWHESDELPQCFKHDDSTCEDYP